MLSRRGFLSGLGAALAAPAIVPFASLMPVRGMQSLSVLRPEDAAIARMIYIPPGNYDSIYLYDEIYRVISTTTGLGDIWRTHLSIRRV